MTKLVLYFLVGAILWIVVDFFTTSAVRDPSAYYRIYFPTILLFYIGYPLIFSLLIYGFHLRERSLFLATVFGMLFVEILFTHNAEFFSFPLLFLAIPIAIGIYSFLTFVPKWIVEGEIKKNRWKVLILTGVVVVVGVLTIFGSA